MILIKNITKSYGNNVGNFNINLKIQTGTVLGLLGPNGAGKSTLIRQMMGFIYSDSGTISFDEFDAKKDHDKIVANVGYVSGELNLFEHLTGKQYLELTRDFKPNTDKEYLEKLIKYFELDIKRKIKKMSKGMKQKVAVIAALMNKPKFLILDEPTSGLDPIMQKRFIKLIKKLNKENKSTVIICSHIFEEVIEAADQIAFIKDGQIVENFSSSQIDKIEDLKIRFEKIYADEVEI